MPVPWKAITTLAVLGGFGIASLVAGFEEGALVAAGALAGYLGKLNGS